jgi:hypothetical protein
MANKNPKQGRGDPHPPKPPSPPEVVVPPPPTLPEVSPFETQIMTILNALMDRMGSFETKTDAFSAQSDKFFNFIVSTVSALDDLTLKFEEIFAHSQTPIAASTKPDRQIPLSIFFQFLLQASQLLFYSLNV